MDENPYAAPDADLLTDNPVSDSEQIRRHHLNAESNLKAIGGLFVLGSVFALLIRITALLDSDLDLTSIDQPFIFYLRYLGAPLGILALGVGLQYLSRIAHTVAVILSLAGLTLPPIGTIICIVFLLVLLSKKERFVTTPQYKEVIAQTRHLKSKGSIITKIFIMIVILFIVLGIISSITD